MFLNIHQDSIRVDGASGTQGEVKCLSWKNKDKSLAVFAFLPPQNMYKMFYTWHNMFTNSLFLTPTALHSEHCYVWHSYTNIFMSMDRIVPTMLVKLKCAYYTYVGVDICWPTFALFSELVSRGRKIRPALPLPTQFWAKKFN